MHCVGVFALTSVFTATVKPGWNVPTVVPHRPAKLETPPSLLLSHTHVGLAFFCANPAKCRSPPATVPAQQTGKHATFVLSTGCQHCVTVPGVNRKMAKLCLFFYWNMLNIDRATELLHCIDYVLYCVASNWDIVCFCHACESILGLFMHKITSFPQEMQPDVSFIFSSCQ